jgi:hypothetical protein
MTPRTWVRGLVAHLPRTIRKEPARFRPLVKPLE